MGLAPLAIAQQPPLAPPPDSPYAQPAPPGQSPYRGYADEQYPQPSPFGVAPPNSGFQQEAIIAQEFEGAMRIATVGDEVIFASDVLPRIDKMLEEHRDQIPPEHLQRQRWMLVQQALESMLDAKRVMQDFKRTMPADRMPIIREQVDESFEKSRLPHLMEALEANTRADLDAKLREEGSSLKGEKNKFFERSLAQQWMRQQTNAKKTFSHDELVAYYDTHQAEFEKTAKARWQQLSVRFASHPDKAAAHAKIAEMGNAVLQGADFGEVAKTGSDGFTADKGGERDWTEPGNLVSKQLDHALFNLPVHQMSPIIEGPKSFHIIRVLEREDQHVTPFRDAQVEITKKLQREAEKVAIGEYQTRLKEQVRVWTIFDDPAFRQRVGMSPGPTRR